MTIEQATLKANQILDTVDSYCNLDGVDDMQELKEQIVEIIGYEI